MDLISDSSQNLREVSRLFKPPTPDNATPRNASDVGKEAECPAELEARQVDGHSDTEFNSGSEYLTSTSNETLFTPSPPGYQYGETAEQSAAQEYWWSLNQQQPALAWYLMSSATRFQGPLRLDALNIAIAELKRRYGCLRTTFSSVDGISIRKMQPFQQRTLKITDVPSFDGQGLRGIVGLEQANPFNLESEPAWRVSLYRRDNQDHILYIILHRILSDIMDVETLQRDLFEFYWAAVRGQDLSFDPQSPRIIPYNDFITQVERYRPRLEKQLEFWEMQLEGSRPAELLPDKLRPLISPGQTALEQLTVKRDVLNNLRRFCEETQVTPFVVLLAAFRTAHYRMTGTSDAVIGTMRHYRDIEDEDVAGSTEVSRNTHCFRIKLEGDDPFQQVVRQVHATDRDIEAFAKPHVSLERLVRKLARGRTDLSRHPLTQILFAFHSDTYENRYTPEGINLERLFLPTASRFDLELHLNYQGDALRVGVRFSTILFMPETISSMLAVFHGVLERGLIDPDTPVASLNLFTQVDHAALKGLDLLRVPTTDYPRDASVVDIFQQQATATPDTVAVKDSYNQLTYAELDRQSDIVARWLMHLSLSPETLVGVFASRSSQTIVAFMGILKAGLAYLPFDTATPHGRMETILSSIKGSKIVLVGSYVQVPPIKEEVQFVQLSDILGNQDTNKSEGPRKFSSSRATSLAYVMFTSGSTGLPKGVMVEHRGIVRLVKGCNMATYLPKYTTMAHLTSIGFDNSTWEIYGPLLNGGTLVCIDPTTVLDCIAIGRVFIQEGVQSAMLTPSLLKQYLIGYPDAIATLEMLCVQGEKADVEDMFLAQKLSNSTVINAYGPTENSVTSTFFVLNDSASCTNGVPIGQPLSNSGAYVMDVNQRIVPLGVIGELVVTGDGLARGYTDPQRNVDVFISININGEAIKGYRTGDYVRYRPVDGQLEFFGRIDGQVKIRGNRLELGEIENIIRSHDCVADAVAVVQNNNQEARLAAYIVLREIRPGSFEESTLVETWLDHWDVETYTPMDNVQLNDIGRDFIGWTSMHDGSDIPRAEMNEWLDETIDAILDGGAAGHVLEIGTGSGMILFNLTKELQSYVGLEPSGRAVDFVTKAAALMPEFAGKVAIHRATAADVSRLSIPISPDTVILNSVIQYFPSQDYLLRVIKSLIDTGTERIFLGDVRSFALHREFLAARALFIAGSGNLSRDEFRRIMVDVEKSESELLIDPSFFTSLPRRLPSIGHVEILPKRMRAVNELSCYRYAAVLHINRTSQKADGNLHEINQTSWIDFATRKMNRQSLLHLLKNSPDSDMVAISNIPDSKTVLERSLLEALDAIEGMDVLRNDDDWITAVRQQTHHRPSMSTDDMVLLAQQTGWHVEFSWARQYSQGGGMDAVFYRHQHTFRDRCRAKFRFPVDTQSRPYNLLSSQPLRRQLRRKVQDQLQQTLQANLPSYMVPQLLTFLDKLPVNQSNKVDRKTLATYGQSQKAQLGQSQQPTSEAERRMQQVWSQVLKIDSRLIGRNDSFFTLGGDSIAAMMVVSESRKIGIKIAVADIFRWPVLHELAGRVEVLSDEVLGRIAPFSLISDRFDTASLLREISTCYGIDQATIRDIYPCTPLQEGLIFETLKHPGAYMRQAVVELSSDISEKRLCEAWEAVVRAKAILRTRVVEHNQLGLLQVVLDEPITWVNVTTTCLLAYLEADKEQSMDLGQPLSHYAIIRDEAGLPKWLVWSANHALYDGWSLHLIQNALYQAFQDPSIEIEMEPQFQAFVKYIKDQDGDKAIKYWQKVLAASTWTPFPSLPPTVEYPIADKVIKQQLLLPPNMGRDITMSILARAAWAIVIGQMTNSDDIVFGMTLYGRNAPVAGLDKMTAPTIATVPVRVSLARNQRCSEYLARLQQEATEMIPFEQTGLQNIAKTGSSGQDACKFQTQLVIQTGEDHCNDCPFGEWQQGSEEKGFTTYAFTLELWLHPSRITATAMFDSRVIRPWLVSKMMKRLEWVMHQLADARPTQELTDIEMSLPEDLEQIWRWNKAVPIQVNECLHDIFQAKARSNPSAQAIFAWDGELTYGRLEELSTRLAIKLVDLGVASDVLVPLCFEKSMWTIVAILGVLKAGGGFVLLDSTLPEDRLKGIVEQVRGHLIISSAPNKGLASRLAAETIHLDLGFFTTLNDHQSPLTLRNISSPSSMAYVTFTSGSTGTPKGVVITHGNLASALHHQAEIMGLTSESRLYDFANYSFDVSISNIFTVLAAGACLCIPSDEERKNNLEQSIISLRANALDLTPSVAQLLSPARLPEVRSLTLGGEALHGSDISQWWKAGKVQIINAYGPCECTPTSLVNYNASSLEDATRIGKGAGAVTWIVNPEDHNDLLPLGCTGELLLEGPIVGQGYLNNPAKTAASFIENPAWLLRGAPGSPGRCGRLYKTGDLVSYDEYGSLTYLSRKDAQVKIRGQRVELGEIEHVLRSQDYVDDAVAVIQGDNKQETWIAGFVTVHNVESTHEDQEDNHGDEAQQQIKSWEDQFDGDTYASIDTMQFTTVGKDFIGWTSMLDGRQFDNDDMNEWLNDTITTILNSCSSPFNVLEIGTGSGMILFNLANVLQSYIGLEPSGRAVDFTTQAAKSIPRLKDKVQIFKATAADIPRLVLDRPISPDLVIINSVVQYFPSQEYLFSVIKDVIQLGSVKTIFFGDIRSFALHREFLAIRALHIHENASQEELDRIVTNLKRSEPELLVDPGFFTSLPDRLQGCIDHVEILPKVVNASNELSCYRYAAVVHLASHSPKYEIREISEDSWVNFKEQGLNGNTILDLLKTTPTPATLAVSNIPYSKISFPRAIVDSIECQQSRQQLQVDWLSSTREYAESCNSLSAINLVELAQQAGYRVEISWARQFSQFGGMDAIFHRYAENSKHGRTMFRFPTDHHGRAHHLFSTQPLRQQMESKARQRLEEKLRAQLPSYMVPQTITILDQMPITKNGKIDRQMLAASCQARIASQGIKQQPVTTLEKKIHKIWSDVLNIKPSLIGVHDGFIQLGGNSLGAMKVVTMARQVGIGLAVADMFRHAATSIHQLALQLTPKDEVRASTSSYLTSTSKDLATEIARYDAQIATIQAKAAATYDAIVDGHKTRRYKALTILLTGANGFIGTQILRQLLEHSQVSRVIAIVRGESAEKARHRTINAAKNALWWTEFHDEMLEVWPGDLSLPRLGLDLAKWRLIEAGNTVDVIIHNGASVHFMKSYEVLEAANVASTAEMLRATALSRRMKFVYVSSARHQTPSEEEDEDIIRDLVANSNGYSQTKFVSEALVRRAALRSPKGSDKFAVVSPGLVIGTPSEGVANADDWIWRLAGACIRVGMYNANNSDAWIPISDAAITATTIIDRALSHSSNPITQVKGGMTFGEFWKTLALTGYKLEARDGSECAAAIRRDIEVSKEAHPLWTLSDMLDSLEDTTKDVWATSWREGGISPVRLKVALKKSANFLSGVGFLPSPEINRAARVEVASVKAFNRSGA